MAALGFLAVGHTTFYVDHQDAVAAAARQGAIPALAGTDDARSDTALFRAYARLHLGPAADGGFIDHLRLVAIEGTTSRERAGWPRAPRRDVERTGWQVWAGWLGQAALVVVLPAFGLAIGWFQAAGTNMRRTPPGRTARPAPERASAPQPAAPAPLVEVPAFRPGALLGRFVREGWRFLPPGLLTLAALALAPAFHHDAFVWLFASGLYLTAAADVMAEDGAERELFNLDRYTSHFIGLCYPGAVVFLLALPLLAAPGFFTAGEQWPLAALTGLLPLAAALWVAARLWPAYVTPWLFRGWGEADVWRDRSRFNPMVSDWPIAWRLTRLPGAHWAATVWAVGVPLLAVTGWVLLRWAAPWPSLVVVLDLAGLFLVMPLSTLVVLDRARALRDTGLATRAAAEAAARPPPPPAPSEDPRDQALFNACVRGAAQAEAERLLAEGADPNHRTPSRDPLPVALAGRVEPEPMAALLHHGADPDIADEAGRTALHVAAIGHQPAMVALLLEAGADPYRRDREGMTPYQLADRYGAPPETLERLAAATGRTDDPGHRLAVLLHAISEGNVDAVERALRHPALPADRGRLGRAVHHAAVSRDAGALTALLDAGLPWDVPDDHGNLPIHTAAAVGNPEGVRRLLERGARPDVQRRDGLLPLALAVAAGGADRATRLALARLLLEAGSPRRGRAPGGESLRAAARARGLDELLEVLPAEPGEPPVDPGARGVAAVHLYDDGEWRVSYHPNRIHGPFSVASYEGRDGWMPAVYPVERFGELRELLDRFGLSGLGPLLESWEAGAPLPLTEFLGRFRDETGLAPVIEGFDGPEGPTSAGGQA